MLKLCFLFMQAYAGGYVARRDNITDRKRPDILNILLVGTGGK